MISGREGDAVLTPEAGFTDIVEKKFIWPIGPWPSDPHLKDLGRWGERNWADGLEAWVLALYTRVLGVSLSFSPYPGSTSFFPRTHQWIGMG
jgi:hypothetical protein